MSRLDQAIFKAYAKDGRTNAPPVVAAGGTGILPVNRQGQDGPATSITGARAMDQIYHEGVLYRVEAQPIGMQQRERGVPAPHLSMLPPTSPRRSVRRSMLRMFSAHSAAANADSAIEAPPRIARKVIIRH